MVRPRGFSVVAGYTRPEPELGSVERGGHPGGSASRCLVTIRQRLLEHHRRREEKDRGEDTDDWILNDPDLAWRTWALMETTGWRFLPIEGGLLDQPETLIDDLMTMAWLYGLIEGDKEQ